MSDTSVFDADAFLGQTTDQEGSTVYPTIPEDDYTGMIDKLDPRQFQNKNGETSTVLDVYWRILDEKAKAAIGRDEVIVKQGIFVDMLPNGAIDWGDGKNVKLGRLRDACGQNIPGQPWSPRSLIGQGPLLLHVGVRADPDDPDTKYNDVKRVAKAA